MLQTLRFINSIRRIYPNNLTRSWLALYGLSISEKSIGKPFRYLKSRKFKLSNGINIVDIGGALKVLLTVEDVFSVLTNFLINFVFGRLYKRAHALSVWRQTVMRVKNTHHAYCLDFIKCVSFSYVDPE